MKRHRAPYGRGYRSPEMAYLLNGKLRHGDPATDQWLKPDEVTAKLTEMGIKGLRATMVGAFLAADAFWHRRGRWCVAFGPAPTRTPPQ